MLKVWPGQLVDVFYGSATPGAMVSRAKKMWLITQVDFLIYQPQHRYHICVSGSRRFNHAIEWINSGQKGYFYNAENLEEDLLFLCLGEGIGSAVVDSKSAGGKEIAKFADKDAKTSTWLTQEVWARTAWRIVQDNRGDGQLFADSVESHPATCYAFAIDLLCLAFHSIAFRGGESVYTQIIMGCGNFTGAGIRPSLSVESQDEQDHGDATSPTSGGGTDTTNASDTDAGADADFMDETCSPATSLTESSGSGEHWLDSMDANLEVPKIPVFPPT